MKTLRYTTTLRPEHPHEARLIEDLASLPTGRRADRVRGLLRAGITRLPPPVNWQDPSQRGGQMMLPMRLAIYIHDTALQDADLRGLLENVAPTMMSEFLRERLAAGLIGYQAPLDLDLSSKSEQPRQMKNAPPDKANETATFNTSDRAHSALVPNFDEGESLVATNDPSSGRIKIPGLSKLFE